MRRKGAAVHNDITRSTAAEYAATNGGVHGVGGVQCTAVDIHRPVEFHLAAVGRGEWCRSIIRREGGAVDGEDAAGKNREVGSDVQRTVQSGITKRKRIW